MAENSILAFGRYLKTLRERRGLSLDEVASLSQTFPEKINKGYMSRCENGRQKLAFSKVIALSRIYEVPADVLVERMELDLELERVGGPATEGLSFAELTEAGKDALQQGMFLDGYGYMRDAIQKSYQDPIKSTYRDRDEQIVVAQTNCGTAATAMGRRRYALHEFLFLNETGKFSPKFLPLVLERISCCYTAMREFDLAEDYINQAITAAEGCDDSKFLGYVYYTKARIGLFSSDVRLATKLYQKAYRAYKNSGEPIGCALSLNSLAQCYFEMKRYKSARLAAEASERLTRKHGRQRTRALSLILLGELDELENNRAQALRRWRAAAKIGKELNDKVLRFKAEFALLRRASRDGDTAVSRAIQRRLRRLAPGLPKDIEELDEFSRLLSQKLSPSQD